MEPERKWEYCTLVATDSGQNRMLMMTILRPNGPPEGHHLGPVTTGAAIARLGAAGWEMCGFYTVNFPDGLGQQFYFKRPVTG